MSEPLLVQRLIRVRDVDLTFQQAAGKVFPGLAMDPKPKRCVGILPPNIRAESGTGNAHPWLHLDLVEGENAESREYLP